MVDIPSYQITDVFSPKQFNQTDFGHIYFNLPKEISEPKTAEELATALKHYHQKGERVIIRNTGHSVNGQTLTNGVQINIGQLKKIHVNKEKMEVTVGAGNTWDEVLQGIGFPKFCLPVFPNNPGQQIHIGGTASVGGVGPYCSKHGGFWNSVKRIKLVTMKGEIITCSPTENTELFQYSLGGFGRIGVIAEVTVRIVPSKENMIGVIIPYLNAAVMEENVRAALVDPLFEGVVPQVQISPFSFGGKMHTELATLLLLIEVDAKTNVKNTIQYIKKTYHQDFMFFVQDRKQKDFNTDISFKTHTFPKKELVYFYPKQKGHDQLSLLHPWADFIIPPSQYQVFVSETRKVLKKYELGQYLVKESLMHDMVNLDVLVNYAIKKIPAKIDFPLSLDLPEVSDFSYSLGVMPNIPPSQIEIAMTAAKELTDLIYELKGKRYLYGVHKLSKKQIVQQFGKKTIAKWQDLKDELDPKHLLNIGVIEHLDI